jgi:hypothetical protein
MEELGFMEKAVLELDEKITWSLAILPLKKKAHNPSRDLLAGGAGMFNRPMPVKHYRPHFFLQAL